jgi:hypothetical protein|tara:strand:+ start:503 stop:772 length:270 start_codon:yes stop_codon:yes gene_type:complete
MENLVSPCCKSDYESSTDSACCTATLQMGLCSDCLEHSESEGYVCNTCEDWFDEPVKEKHTCGFCGTDLESDCKFCSQNCYAAEFSEYT